MRKETELNKVKEGIDKLAYILEHKSKSLSPVQVHELINQLNYLKQQYRIIRSEQDILFFTYEYFSEDRNPENDNNLIPKGIKWTEAPKFHRELTEALNEICWENPTKNIGWSCPRGHAKSTYLSNVMPLYSIVFNLRHYILIVSETGAMAQKFVEWVAGQLKFNKKLREDFGELLHPNKIANEKDNAEAFVTTNNIRVQASSIGKQLRGARHGAYRPDLVILDDLESAKNTNTKELREKNFHWFTSVIRPIGDPTRTSFIYMGTMVHAQGLLPAVLNMSDFSSRIYSAVVSSPDREDLWFELEEILRDYTNTERLEKAYQFYLDNKEEMDKGVEVLWAERFSYFELIRIKTDIGSRSFASEYLNRPAENEDAIFRPEHFQFYEKRDLMDKDGKPLKLTIYGFWDIALGKNSRSDYNAIVTIGVDKRTGEIYVLDAWASKCKMHEALEVVFQKIQQYKHHTFGVETIQAQYDAYRQLKEKLTKANIYQTRIKPVTPKSRKEERIERLQPLFENGVIKMHRSQRLLQEMLEQYPEHDHDDLPDALAGVVDLIKAKTTRGFTRKPLGM
jgi:predicted phage terminase large subunit-like protein